MASGSFESPDETRLVHRELRQRQTPPLGRGNQSPVYVELANAGRRAAIVTNNLSGISADLDRVWHISWNFAWEPLVDAVWTMRRGAGQKRSSGKLILAIPAVRGGLFTSRARQPLDRAATYSRSVVLAQVGKAPMIFLATRASRLRAGKPRSPGLLRLGARARSFVSLLSMARR